MLRCRSELGVRYLSFCCRLILHCDWKYIKIWFYAEIKAELSQGFTRFIDYQISPTYVMYEITCFSHRCWQKLQNVTCCSQCHVDRFDIEKSKMQGSQCTGERIHPPLFFKGPILLVGL